MKRYLAAATVAILLISQTACTFSNYVTIASVAVKALSVAAEVLYPQDATYIQAADACVADFSGLYSGGATPSAGAVAKVLQECTLSVPTWPGESAQTQLILAAVDAAIYVIVNFLPSTPTQVGVTWGQLEKEKLPTAKIDFYHKLKIKSVHAKACDIANALVMKGAVRVPASCTPGWNPFE